MIKHLFSTFTIALLLSSNTGYSQLVKKNNNGTGNTSGTKDKNLKTRWKTNPFNDQYFIENKGQFDDKTSAGEKVLYGVQLGDVDILFTKNKVVYRYDKYYYMKSIDAEGAKDDPNNFRHEIHILNAEWLNANKTVSVEMKDKQKNYYTYPDGTNKGIKADLFKQLTYKNLYPGIDAVYGFIEGKAGLKYSLIVHPGADISKIKIGYSGANSITKNKDGDIIINSEINVLTEHAPVANYEGEPGGIAFSNVIAGNTESFKADESYDKSKTLVIDPWQTDPLFTPWDKAFDLDWDYYGSVYAYGGHPAHTLMLTKMDKTGAILWTFNCTSFPDSYYGDIAVDKVNGTIYVEEGFGGVALKVNTNGILESTFPGNPDETEYWRADYDACNGDIVIAGGGTSGEDQAGVLDTNMTTINPVNIMGVTSVCHDNSLMTIDPNGSQCYIASARSLSVDPLHADNVIMQLPLPALSPTIYEVHENDHFIEVSSITYAGQDLYNESQTNAMNGAACSPQWLYLYNGDTVRRYNKTNGILSNALPISQNTPFEYGGLAVDPCNTLFVGVEDSIYIFDSTYAVLNKITLPDTIYDLQLGQGTALYACGKGYVTQLVNPNPPKLISSASGSPTSCSACNGTATVNVNCGIEPYTFRWSNGSTNETDTGLCAGLYTVTVTDGACPPHSDTAIVSISGKPGYTAAVVDTNPNCALSPGNITVYPTGGTSPYTYSWSNGATTQEITGLSAGTYICTITDADGCKYEVPVTLVNPITPNLIISPKYDSICAGSTVSITASGLKTYTWTPNYGLTCYVCPNPTASPTATTTYTIAAVDSNGCTATNTTTVKVLPIPKPIITGKDSICVGYKDTLSVTGGTTYLWSNGATTTSISGTISSNQTFTVTAYNGICSHDTTFTVYVIASPTAVAVAKPDSVCQGDSTQLSASGGAKYLWSNGKTTSTIWVVPTSSTTYTLVAYAGTCSNTTTITVNITPLITATISKNDTVCPNTPITLTATGSGGAVTYKWNTGATSSSISVKDTVTTTYTATVYGKCDSVKQFVTVEVVPLPKPVITGTPWKCAGKTDTLSVTGGTTYKWSDGKTTTTYITGPINNDSTITVIAYNSLGCPDTAKYTVDERIKPNIKPIPSALSCNNSDVTLEADASGTGPYSYKWSNGATTSSITVADSVKTTYTVTVSNGCPNSTTGTVSPDVPPLSACCSTVILAGTDTIMTAFGKGIIGYSWSPPTGLNCDTCPTVIATPSVTTTYTVTGTDSLGCQVQRFVTIIVETPCFNFTVPNVFTPDFANTNTGGVDNVFYIKTENITGWSTIIYDRWGKEMFKTTNPDVFWTGETESGGKAPDGVYYYIISGTCNNNTYKKDGFLQLIR